MKKPTTSIIASLGFFICFGQDPKAPSDLTNLSDSDKRKYFDGASNKIDTLSGLTVFEASGYIRPQNLPATSPVFQMIEYIKYQVSVLDSSDLRRGHTFYIYPLKFSDSIFFRNKYFSKGGQILK